MIILKKVTAVLLSVLMIAAAGVTVSAADDEIIASGTGGEGITWTLTKGGTMTVSGSGPITDKVEIEYYDDESTSSTKVDSIGIQMNTFVDESTAGMSYEEQLRFRYNLVKTLIIEEGITAIPDNEFEEIYPCAISLPASLKTIEYGAINGMFAESLTVSGSSLLLNAGVLIAAHEADAEKYNTVDEAREALIESYVKNDEISNKTIPVYDLGVIFEIKNGISTDLTAEEYIGIINDAYETAFTTLDECEEYLLKKANEVLSTSYQSADEIFSIEEDAYEGSSYSVMNDEPSELITAMYEENRIDNRLTSIGLNNENEDDYVAYQWLTVYAPSGSTAEKAAKSYSLPFVSTGDEEEDTSFFGRIKSFFEKAAEFLKTLFNTVSDFFSKIFTAA